jgi:pimeloyl-ACP methyl ester carboxylesterase
VLVPHSYGGFVAELYARTYPAQVAGLVMVDAASSRLRHTLSPEKLAVWDQTNRQTSAQVREGVQVLDALDRLDAAPPMPELSAVVLAADKPYRTDLIPPELVDKSLGFADWKAAQDLLAPYLRARYIADTNSGHHVYLYSPQQVVDAVRDVVDTVRARGR